MAQASVTVHLPGPLRPYCQGAAQFRLEAATVGQALQEIERTNPALFRNVCEETGALRRHLNVFVNSDHIRDRNGLETVLRAGDVLTFLPAVSGG
jgi:molybdopterin converting factor small subunit